MKVLLTIIFLLYGFYAIGQKADTSMVKADGNAFYLVQQSGNTGIIIFLHGGVDNPYFSDPMNFPGLDYLLEGNTNFIATALENHFDVLIPVVNDSLNWLTNPEYCFQAFKKQLDVNPKYNRRFMTGFSDGGTGSYKIFYTHQKYFHGLMVFNGYPQHENFNQTVQYKLIDNKKIVFSSTENDKVVPYEFGLTEYCKQKIYNPDTYIYVAKGGHTFQDYTREDLNVLFDVIKLTPDNLETQVVHGFVTHDKLIAFYPFRDKIFSKYQYEKEIYEENKQQRKLYQPR